MQIGVFSNEINFIIILDAITANSFNYINKCFGIWKCQKIAEIRIIIVANECVTLCGSPVAKTSIENKVYLLNL